MTTTDEQIEDLRDEAAAAGDLLQEALCRVALGDDISGRGCIDAWIDSEWAGREIDSETVADARSECERVIEDAAAAE